MRLPSIVRIGRISSIAPSFWLTIGLAFPAIGQQGQHPPHAQQGMGFDQDKTTHHFWIERTGGTIEVTAKDAQDSTSVEQVRPHLRHIAAAFSKGDFSLPMFVHAAEPPGVPVLKERQKFLTYKYEERPKGGRVVIRTSDAAALTALHDFLRYQIREHHTGDPMVPR